MKYCFSLLAFALSLSVGASNLKVSTPLLYIEPGQAYTLFNVSWDNSWYNTNNHDAVWLFFKSISEEGGYAHIKVAQEGHKVVSVFSNDPKLEFEVPKDGTGLFLKPGNTFRGRVEVTLKINLDRPSFRDVDQRGWYFNAYGIEMVNIPQGGFTLGDPDPAAQEFGSFYAPNKRGKPSGLVEITSQNQVLTVSETGDLFYNSGEYLYEGDQQGPIPATYPKGVSPFYMMKYEPTEGQYVAFLNSLRPDQSAARIIHTERRYASQGGTITPKNGKYITPNPNKPCLFFGWDDAMAFADWAGLRPMTEFEYTKAARGTSPPKAHDFPWGTHSKEKIQRIPNPDRTLGMVNSWDESHLTDETKAHFGASYYWVMDLAGSVWERVITVGHSKGRAFTGVHGDGVLSANGTADVQDWPYGESDGGIGFRGGGFYGHNQEYQEFNPFSPVAYRRYGGWHGAMRNNAYSARFVRSID
ncbi:SUMF1/EgtB/PvdO family nonheme iron enzyme [Flagellimonas myxillae]|uniref:SUMF1/EgtB/PvdO family nonheme iron enzyme n=1 Tax=Flagellimonas myxillae TaxID=2942214 RepID=UPI00201F1D30|nr:SUMF1/EgtB/PvdO family nonheme iron enzyme [Muricauda myxillae]MCL6267459.1 formylglycine-generating enzyme family protein [Muricauda myxillae]